MKDARALRHVSNSCARVWTRTSVSALQNAVPPRMQTKTSLPNSSRTRRTACGVFSSRPPGAGVAGSGTGAGVSNTGAGVPNTGAAVPTAVCSAPNSLAATGAGETGGAAEIVATCRAHVASGACAGTAGNIRRAGRGSSGKLGGGGAGNLASLAASLEPWRTGAGAAAAANAAAATAAGPLTGTSLARATVWAKAPACAPSPPATTLGRALCKR
mmetsp:Transcript_129548/g.276281  ORF Transcript_129548/g.276281 Transcript_129548/m.276281 type:complete len:215 (-) Transcript_129548:995-1639(-)